MFWSSTVVTTGKMSHYYAASAQNIFSQLVSGRFITKKWRTFPTLPSANGWWRLKEIRDWPAIKTNGDQQLGNFEWATRKKVNHDIYFPGTCRLLFLHYNTLFIVSYPVCPRIAIFTMFAWPTVKVQKWTWVCGTELKTRFTPEANQFYSW